MLILAEKPSVAKDFANALFCKWSNGVYSSSTITIINCIGHLFSLEEPNYYTTDFPIIPDRFDYCINQNTAAQSKLVVKILKEHKNDSILIATDADREGEIIARECLAQAGITDFSKIKRFWVSQALTPEVIKAGINAAKPLSDYNKLAAQGFARQHADWLVGMNFSRYMSKAARKLPVGRVQTAILAAIYHRDQDIKNFKPQKYFEFYGTFQPTRVASKSMPSLPSCKGIYFESETACFPDNSEEHSLKSCIGKAVNLINSKSENKNLNPPQLYNLNAVQKDAFKYFGYTAKKTLEIIQSLYEDLKCVSYPRTPSRVMGSKNVDLCKTVYRDLCKTYRQFQIYEPSAVLSLCNRRCFNDAQLEAHHALIPLKSIPANATAEQACVYFLILERFMIAFLPEEQYQKQTFILAVENKKFRVTGKKVSQAGWQDKRFQACYMGTVKKTGTVQNEKDREDNEDIQSLENINWNSLFLTDFETKEKWTKPPKHFNEASILSFMENPKETEPTRVGSKLVGLGTPATRHTFIPKLINNGYIEMEKKNFICTKLGAVLLDYICKSDIKSLADVSATTSWEEQLEDNPGQFELNIKKFVRDSVKSEAKIDTSNIVLSGDILCPVCNKPIKESAKSWFCTGYKEGCTFKSLWKETRGTTFSKSDIKALCSGKKTAVKKCTKKDGGFYECPYVLNENYELTPVFERRK